MGIISCNDYLTTRFECRFDVHLKDSSITTILSAFCKLLPELLTDFIQKVVTGYGEYAMALEKKPFCCDKCGNNRGFIWKTRQGKETKILTVFQWVILRQLQVQCKECGHKMYLLRKFLGMEPMQRIPACTYRKIGLIGSLTTYRVAEKIVTMFGWAIDKMTVWKSVQKTAQEIEYKLDPKEKAIGEADGTGISISGIKKRGKELKVLVQYKHGGGIRVAGVHIGNYNGGWDKFFKNSMNALKRFRRFLLITDGDTSILDSLTHIIHKLSESGDYRQVWGGVVDWI